MKSLTKVGLWIVWLALFAWGLAGMYKLFTEGRDLANYGSYVPWGLWVSAYIYFVGLSAGAFLLSSLVYVFGFQKLAKIGRSALWVAAITLLIALVSIWLDLGQKWRFWEVYTRPQFTSMMTWMVWLYTAYFILVLVELWVDMRCDLARWAGRGGMLAPAYRLLCLGHKCPEAPEQFEACHQQSRNTLRVLGALGVPLAVAFHGGVGALFATLAARPFWHHSIFPVLFLTGALVSGGGLLLAIVALTYRGPEDERRSLLKTLSYIVVGLLLFDLLLEWAEFSIPMWYDIGRENAPLRLVLFGEYWYVFWIIHLLLGGVIPLVLLLWKPSSRLAAALGGGLVAVTFLAVRLNIVIPGQVIPALEGLRDAYVDRRLTFDYVPSEFEWSVVAFLAAAGIALFYLGSRLLPLHEAEPKAD